MCGGSYVGRGMKHGAWRHHGGGTFLGRDVEEMSSGARITAALLLLVPVALSGLFLVAFVPSLWWIFTTYFWVASPLWGCSRAASRVLVRVVLSGSPRRSGSGSYWRRSGRTERSRPQPLRRGRR